MLPKNKALSLAEKYGQASLLKKVENKVKKVIKSIGEKKIEKIKKSSKPEKNIKVEVRKGKRVKK